MLTNRQFQEFVRLTIAKIKAALKETPENQELLEIFRDMLEDGN